MLWALAVVIIVLLVIYTILDTFVIIDGAQYGVHLRFGKRTGRIMLEGLRLKIPFVDKVALFSTELDKIDVNTTFTTHDKLQLRVNGSLHYRPDSRISDDHGDMRRPAEERKGKNTFFAMSDEIIKSGIEDALQAMLGGLGGVYLADKFIENRQALSSLINAILRLQVPPHLNHDPAKCGVKGCRMANMVPAPKLVDFYNKHWEVVKGDLDQETQHEHECSTIELRYGIDVETFALAIVDFTEETKKAFEKKKQGEAGLAAFTSKMKMAKQVKDELGASAQEALNAADVSLNPSMPKQVISVEGQGGILGGFLGNLTGGNKK